MPLPKANKTKIIKLIKFNSRYSCLNKSSWGRTATRPTKKIALILTIVSNPLNPKNPGISFRTITK